MWIEIVKKMLSARFWISLFVTITACAGFYFDRISGEQFVAAWVLIIGFYFNRERSKPND